MIYTSRSLHRVSLILILLQLAPNSWAAGKKRSEVAPSSAALHTPIPVRHVRLKTVSTRPFQLPNGTRVDLTADLQALLGTAVTATPVFSPTDGPSEGPCDTEIEIRAAVSTLELNVAELKLSFGYTPSGEKSTITDLNGTAKVKIGTIAMDFSVWECVAGRCSAVAATTASHATAGVNLDLTIDFGAIKTGPSLVYNTPLGEAVRKIMNDGMKRMASSARLSELGWSARVRDFDPQQGEITMDAGLRSRLAPDQTFVVYAASEGGNICDVFKAVAYVHTVQVDTVSSVAVVDKLLDARGIRAGDLVMVREAK